MVIAVVIAIVTGAAGANAQGKAPADDRPRFEVATVKLAAPDAVRTRHDAAAGGPESAVHPEHDAVDADLFRVR